MRRQTFILKNVTNIWKHTLHVFYVFISKNVKNGVLESKTFRPEIHLVFEFCEHDLAGLLANKSVNFSLGEKKKIIQQLLEGIAFCISWKFILLKNKIVNYIN